MAVNKETLFYEETQCPGQLHASQKRSKKQSSIDCLLENEKGVICHLPTDPLLCCLGFRPGKCLQMIAKQKFGGPLVVKINGRCVALSRSLAKQVKIEGQEAGSPAVGVNV